MTQLPDDPTAPINRRQFLKSSALACASVTLGPAFLGQGVAGFAVPDSSQRLLTGWEHYRGSLSGAWEVWRGGKATDKSA